MSGCKTGKTRYRDELAAMIVLAGMNRRKERRHKNEVRTYRCPMCAGWHLTSRKR